MISQLTDTGKTSRISSLLPGEQRLDRERFVTHDYVDTFEVDPIRTTRSVYFNKVQPVELQEYWYGAVISSIIEEAISKVQDKWTFNIELSERKDYSRSPFVKTHADRIQYGLRLHNSWEENGVSPPNQLAKNIAIDIVGHLAQNNNVTPTRIAASIDEGIFIAYDFWQQFNLKQVIIEVPNAGGIGAVLNDKSGKQVLESVDIPLGQYSELRKLVRKAEA